MDTAELLKILTMQNKTRDLNTGVPERTELLSRLSLEVDAERSNPEVVSTEGI